MSEKKDIRDYLKFYIGCEVEYEGILNGKEMGEEMKANKHDVYYVPKIQAVKGVKRGILKCLEVGMKGEYRRARIGRKGLQSHWGVANFKLCLRRLSDMTEKEALGLCTLKVLPMRVLEVLSITDIGIEFKFESFEQTRTMHLFYDEISPEMFRLLIKAGFDLFGLIDSQLAIETKTPQP